MKFENIKLHPKLKQIYDEYHRDPVVELIHKFIDEGMTEQELADICHKTKNSEFISEVIKNKAQSAYRDITKGLTR